MASPASGKSKSASGSPVGANNKSSAAPATTAASTTAATAALTGGGSIKASVAPPKLSVNGADVELDSLPGVTGPAGPAALEEDIMQLARLGETTLIQKLFESGRFDASYKDEEEITPLHWAAINNQYATCKFLLDAGAEVNAKGGQSMATPAMWAAQQSHYYVVHLLLEYGADPSIPDIQGYTILHLATFSSNAFLLLLLLHQELSVDIPDPQGHTPLMWAAYKGLPLCVDLFLKWGASINAVDDAGLTPLHWALVRGSLPCIMKMLEYGADRFAKTRDGKTPRDVAMEIGTINMWNRALRDSGYTPQGEPVQMALGLERFFRNPNYLKKFFFLWPFPMVYGGLCFVSSMPAYLGIPATLLFSFAMQFVAQRVGSSGPPEFKDLQKTPFLAGVFAASLLWVVVRWVTTVLPGTYQVYPIVNIFFCFFASMVGYFFILSMREDPGYVPKLSSRNQQREIMADLLEARNFDDEHFCVMCLNRKPLRSKHCRRCKRCVSKHDHHCPWIDNCVGVNNLRHFVLYIFSLEIAIWLFIRLVVGHIFLLPPPEDATCNVVSAEICSIISKDPFTLSVTFWASVQLVWVTLLCCVQLVQISRNQTTYENMKSHHYGHGIPSQAFASAIAAGTTSAEAAGLSATGQGPMPAAGTPLAQHRHGQRHGHGHAHGGCCTSLKRILGIDAFMATATDELAGGTRTQNRVNRNPFSQGCLTNCKDFWLDGKSVFGKRENGSARLAGQDVNYHYMFDIPVEARANGSFMGYTRVQGDDAV